MFEVTVKTLDGKNHSFTLPESLNVLQFKEQISRSLNIPVEDQRLIFRGKVLQNDGILNSADMDGKVLHLVERPPPLTTSEGASRTNNDSMPNPAQASRNTLNLANDATNVFIGAFQISDNIGPERLQVMIQNILSGMGAFGRGANVSVSPSGTGVDIEIELRNLSRFLVEEESIRRLNYINEMHNVLRRIIDALQREQTSNEEFTIQVFEPCSSFSASTSTEAQRNVAPQENDRDLENDRNTEVAPTDSAMAPDRTEENRGGISPEAFAELIRKTSELQNQLNPHIENYIRILEENSPASQDVSERTRQNTYLFHVAEAMHLIGHVYHNLSDLNYNPADNNNASYIDISNVESQNLTDSDFAFLPNSGRNLSGNSRNLHHLSTRNRHLLRHNEHTFTPTFPVGERPSAILVNQVTAHVITDADFDRSRSSTITNQNQNFNDRVSQSTSNTIITTRPSVDMPISVQSIPFAAIIRGGLNRNNPAFQSENNAAFISTLTPGPTSLVPSSSTAVMASAPPTQPRFWNGILRNIGSRRNSHSTPRSRSLDNTPRHSRRIAIPNSPRRLIRLSGNTRSNNYNTDPFLPCSSKFYMPAQRNPRRTTANSNMSSGAERRSSDSAAQSAVNNNSNASVGNVVSDVLQTQSEEDALSNPNAEPTTASRERSVPNQEFINNTHENFIAQMLSEVLPPILRSGTERIHAQAANVTPNLAPTALPQQESQTESGAHSSPANALTDRGLQLLHGVTEIVLNGKRDDCTYDNMSVLSLFDEIVKQDTHPTNMFIDILRIIAGNLSFGTLVKLLDGNDVSLCLSRCRSKLINYFNDVSLHGMTQCFRSRLISSKLCDSIFEELKLNLNTFEYLEDVNPSQTFKLFLKYALFKCIECITSTDDENFPSAIVKILQSCFAEFVTLCSYIVKESPRILNLEQKLASLFPHILPSHMSVLELIVKVLLTNHYPTSPPSKEKIQRFIVSKQSTNNVDSESTGAVNGNENMRYRGKRPEPCTDVDQFTADEYNAIFDIDHVLQDSAPANENRTPSDAYLVMVPPKRRRRDDSNADMAPNRLHASLVGEAMASVNDSSDSMRLMNMQAEMFSSSVVTDFNDDLKRLVMERINNDEDFNLIKERFTAVNKKLQ